MRTVAGRPRYFLTERSWGFGLSVVTELYNLNSSPPNWCGGGRQAGGLAILQRWDFCNLALVEVVSSLDNSGGSAYPPPLPRNVANPHLGGRSRGVPQVLEAEPPTVV